MITQKYIDLWIELQKVQKQLLQLRNREEFTMDAIMEHWDLKQEEQMIDCLNKLLYLLNREKNYRRRKYSQNIAKFGYQRDTDFKHNLGAETYDVLYAKFHATS